MDKIEFLHSINTRQFKCRFCAQTFETWDQLDIHCADLHHKERTEIKQGIDITMDLKEVACK